MFKNARYNFNIMLTLAQVYKLLEEEENKGDRMKEKECIELMCSVMEAQALLGQIIILLMLTWQNREKPCKK